MTDLELLVLGGTVSFIALIGAYAYIRESFLARDLAKRKPIMDRPRRRSRRAA